MMTVLLQRYLGQSQQSSFIQTQGISRLKLRFHCFVACWTINL